MTLTKIPFFAHTSTSYAETIFQRLGKGLQHAFRIYSQVMRRNAIDRQDSFFNNSQHIIDEIEALTDFTLPNLHGQKDEGSTGKFLLSTQDNLFIESVCIPMQAGGTLCVSSQVGCRLGCTFCETGRMGLLRNLTPEEIVAQVVIAKHQLGFNIRNVVFMGMGEPFDNYDAVMQAVRVLTDPKGLGFGKRHLTVSTSGLVDGIARFMEESGETPNLAVSITAAEDVLRNKLMPINRKHDLAQLYDAMLAYNRKSGREILIAYVLLQGLNDTPEHAERLAIYLQGLSVKINVIPYNQQTRDRFTAPGEVTIEIFIQHLRKRGYATMRRGTKGREIMAACGQLGNLELKRQRILRANP
ncbi:MAG: 23S rRNA (adenine(2503)-C(2))-methyltransferase RlmN [Parachlamydiaceae bacterium]|nr:23S rRNA (adenine(2503)-C(2))-methyltransferase RlmN [Parachlamydiaceae bacterium]